MNTVIVKISDMNVVMPPDSIVTHALGSCVGICLYDPMTKVGGMSHILLPNSVDFTGDKNVMKYADTAIPELIRRMELKGARKARFTAKIAGGAQMFAAQGIQIGHRNVIAVKQTLQSLGIRIMAEDTGLNYGRTMEFFPDTGKVRVRSFQNGIKEY